MKINVNNIKKEINNHYFKYKDIFYRILITNICVYNNLNGEMIRNTIIDESSYNQYFLYLANKRLSLKELLQELNISEELNLYMDLSLYIEEFLQLKHVNDRINIYSVSISDNGYLLIDNKKLDKGMVDVQP